MIPDQLSIDLRDEDPPVDLPKTTSAASAVSDSRSQRRDDLRGALRSLLARQGLTLLDSDNANCQHLVGACHLSAPAPSETWRSVITCRGKLASVKHGEV